LGGIGLPFFFRLGWNRCWVTTRIEGSMGGGIMAQFHERGLLPTNWINAQVLLPRCQGQMDIGAAQDLLGLIGEYLESHGMPDMFGKPNKPALGFM